MIQEPPSLEFAQKIISLEKSLDMMFMVIAGAMVLLMQVGFSFLEGGCVRYKNLQSIIIKVFANTCVCVTVWWIVGYGIAFGSDDHGDMVGRSNFSGEGYENTNNWSIFMFQTSVAIAANSIVSGGAAERMTYIGYILLSVGFSTIIYPFAAHWGFGGGWLMKMGYHDFAGCGTVHSVGGVGALVTTIMLKPRKNRFNQKFSENFEPNNPTYITLATLSLWTCWCFFNGGSTLGVTDGKNVVFARAVMNTFISGATGGLTVFFIHYFLNSKNSNRYSLVMLCNGNLAGLVSITGSCDNVEPWAAFIIGTIGGCVYILINKLLLKLEIDDPVDAVPIHLGCGLFGANTVSWFDMDKGIFYCGGGKQFGIQLLGCLVFVAWSALFHIFFCGMIDSCNMLRINEQVENEGMDLALSSGEAYKYFSLPLKEMSTMLAKNNTISHDQKKYTL